MNAAELNSESFHKKAILCLAIAFVFRVVYSLVYPVHLAGDEAYYWDWGRRPALGYFSKPPFIAWLYGFVNWLGGGSLFSIRFTAILLGTLSLLVNYILTKKLFDGKTALIAVILALAVPGNCLLNFVLTIDAPLMLAWSLALIFLWKYVKGEQPVLSLILLFLALGIGHLSKQMMLGFPILAIVFLATGKETRSMLKRPGPWLALLGSLVFLIPPYLIWNSQNDWITYKHMGSHVGGHAQPSLLETLWERVEKFFEFLATQLGALSPVTAVLLFILTVVAMFTQRGKIAENHRFLMVFCGVPLVGILIVAMLQKVQPNWPAVLYLAGIPMVAAWFTRALEWYPKMSDAARQKLFRIGIGMGFALCAFFYLGPVVFSVTGNEGHKADPNRRLIGSDRLAKAVQEVRVKVPNWEKHFVMAGGHRYQTGWLAFELPDQPMVYRVTGGRVESQYELWPEPIEDGCKGGDAIYVLPGKRALPPAHIAKAFQTVELLENIQVKFGNGLKDYSIFRCINLQASMRPAKEKT